MKKRIFAIACACVLALNIFSVCATASEGADILYTLFSMDGGFITEDPVYMGGESGKPWLLIGEDVFMTDNGGYPAEFNNGSGKDSFYYMAGSNSIEWLTQSASYNDQLCRDYVFEYVIDYGNTDGAYVSLALAYNYGHYIDVYVTPDGRGDIAIVRGDKSSSMLDSKSILNQNYPDALISALAVEGESLPEKLCISVKVSIDANRMPRRIDVYINGLYAATTGAGFSESVDNLTPVYDESVGTFPSEKLGNIVALRFTNGAVGKIDKIQLYTVGANSNLRVEIQEYYASSYGNASFETKKEPPCIMPPDPVTQPTDTVANTSLKIMETVFIIFGVAIGMFAIITVLILIISRKKRK